MAASPLCKRLLASRGVTRRVVSRFVPGETLEEAAEAIEQLNRAGFCASLNPLGEHTSTEDAARQAAEAYCEVLRTISQRELDSNLSVKLSLLGLDLSPALVRENVRSILTLASELRIFVRFDMESSPTVDETLAIFREMRSEFPQIGVVLQSYLLRTESDLTGLIAEEAPIRMVKGAYREPPSVAFADKAAVDKALEQALEQLAEAPACAVGVATHDQRILTKAEEIIERHELESWEFQLLYGIRRDLQQQLLARGHRVRVYVSYGPDWYPWFMRRLAERPANLLFFFRHLFG